MKLSVIIVSYNVKHFVEQCILSVLKSAVDISTEIYVVDNLSSDDTVSYLKKAFPIEHYPTIHIIANQENVGFGRANNQALAISEGEYVLFLNPDTILTETTLSDCLTFAETHALLGGVGVRMQRPDGRFALESRRGLPTPFTSFCKMTGLSSLFPKSRLLGRYYMRYLKENEAAEIDVVSGAFFFVSRKALAQSGAFDEDFFMYGEDIDLSFRLKKAGLKNYYLPTPILHYKGESTEKTSYRYVRVFYEAMLIFFNKHYRHYSFLFSCSVCVAIYVRAFIAFVWQQLHKLCAFFQKKNRTESIVYTFLGCEEMLRQAQTICFENKITSNYRTVHDGSDLSSVFKTVLKKGTLHYIVLDTEVFSYQSILNLFEKYAHPRISIGTYSLKTHVLVTDYFTYKNE